METDALNRRGYAKKIALVDDSARSGTAHFQFLFSL